MSRQRRDALKVLPLCLVLLGQFSAANAWGQDAPQPPAAKAQDADENLKNMTEHFEAKKDQRGFPMNLFPKDTSGTLLLAAVGTVAAGGLLALGGGTIAMVNYETQTSPQSPPDERLAARGAGRVGLGVFGLGVLMLFAPPVLIDLSLPSPEPAARQVASPDRTISTSEPTEAPAQGAGPKKAEQNAKSVPSPKAKSANETGKSSGPPKKN